MVTLETPRLILRKPKESDFMDVYDAIQDESLVHNVVSISLPYSQDDAKSFIEMVLVNWEKDPQSSYCFFLEHKKDKKVIGALDLNKIHKMSGVASTGSWLHRDYRRQDYMTEAKIAVNNFAFNELNLRKLRTQVFADNLASCKTQEKMGYVKEGYLREHAVSKSDGKIHDEHVYGMLKREWIPKEKELKALLEQKHGFSYDNL